MPSPISPQMLWECARRHLGTFKGVGESTIRCRKASRSARRSPFHKPVQQRRHCPGAVLFYSTRHSRCRKEAGASEVGPSASAVAICCSYRRNGRNFSSKHSGRFEVRQSIPTHGGTGERPMPPEDVYPTRRAGFEPAVVCNIAPGRPKACPTY